MASYRYRSLIPCQELNKQGIDAKVNEGEADTLIFSKPLAVDVPIARESKSQGVKVIVDFCDDHFSHQDLGNLYREMAFLADVITCPTKEMQSRIFNCVSKESVVIPDPYECEEYKPHADGDKKLWFGHQRNLVEILPYLDKYPMTVCTGETDKLTDYVKWSVESQEICLRKANWVVIPSAGNYKSPNRLINSLRMGCFPIVGLNDSHKEFRKFCWVGNITTGLNWAKAFQSDLNELVKEGQEYVGKHYSPEKIGSCWKDVI